MQASMGVRETVPIMGVIGILACAVTWLTRGDMTGRSLDDLEDVA